MERKAEYKQGFRIHSLGPIFIIEKLRKVSNERSAFSLHFELYPQISLASY